MSPVVSPYNRDLVPTSSSTPEADTATTVACSALGRSQSVLQSYKEEV
jgi:hypothetical protein